MDTAPMVMEQIASLWRFIGLLAIALAAALAVCAHVWFRLNRFERRESRIIANLKGEIDAMSDTIRRASGIAKPKGEAMYADDAEPNADELDAEVDEFLSHPLPEGRPRTMLPPPMDGIATVTSIEAGRIKRSAVSRLDRSGLRPRAPGPFSTTTDETPFDDS